MNATIPLTASHTATNLRPKAGGQFVDNSQHSADSR
jgi:hypothetical protein